VLGLERALGLLLMMGREVKMAAAAPYTEDSSSSISTAGGEVEISVEQGSIADALLCLEFVCQLRVLDAQGF
jgi:hypothetical protein